jgi:butyryl-CoA:acetate CoA transferase (EC 2.8.3.8)
MTAVAHEEKKLSNAQIAWRAAQDIADGAYVNLGIGFPEMVARYQPEGRESHLPPRKTAS